MERFYYSAAISEFTAAQDDMSEGEFLIWSLNQHKDWATMVCLVGGGQEINTGACTWQYLCVLTGLKPLAIDVRTNCEIIPWFLNDITDIRSSLFLEDVATGFDVQGLELDWPCLVWDGDFRYNQSGKCWQHFNFRSDKWQNINSQDNRAYQLNSYRVLLTRARQGMIICVPEGSANDSESYTVGTLEFGPNEKWVTY